MVVAKRIYKTDFGQSKPAGNLARNFNAGSGKQTPTFWNLNAIKTPSGPCKC